MTIKVKRTSGVKYLKGFTNEISFAPDRKQYLTDKALVELYNKIEAYLHTLQASQDQSKLLLSDVSRLNEQLSCETCIFNTHSWSEDYPCATCCGFDKYQAT